MGNLTREDIMNGWTEETLEAYLKERQKQKIVFADKPQAHDVKIAPEKKSFNPHNW